MSKFNTELFMMKNIITVKPAFTLIELMVAIALAAIVITGVGIVLTDSQRGWHDMYNRVYADIATDSHVVRKAFDIEIRKACKDKGILLESTGAWVEVYSYASTGSTEADRYTRFYTDSNQLKVERGIIDPRQILTDSIICGNVSSCIFKSAGRSVQMLLTLDNGERSINIITSAVLHN